jgi:hypothetical protein
MSKYTLLQLVQKVLNSIEGDEVNSWSDTVESTLVANIIENCYNDIASGIDMPEDFALMEMQATSSSTPTMMTKPSTVDELLWLKYNKIQDGDTDPVWAPVTYLSPEEFHLRMIDLRPSDTTVDSYTVTVDGSVSSFYYRNDKSPDYYTVFNDTTLVFDSVDTAIETNLQTVKSLGYCRRYRVFTMEDSFVPLLPEQQFPLLLNEAIATAWQDLKQAQNGRAERKARRGMVRLQKSKWDINTAEGAYSQMKGYGRK